MRKVILFFFGCNSPIPQECPDCSKSLEVRTMNDEIDVLSSSVRQLQRQNEILQDQLDLYSAELVRISEVHANIITNKGNIKCMLFPDKAPKATANFVGLAEGRVKWKNPSSNELMEGRFYDGITIHRVVQNQLIQAGDPSGVGTGGPGYTFPDEQNSLRFNRGGVLAMANVGPNTNGSQFFITATAQPALDGKHTIFGQCTNIDIVKEISNIPSSEDERPIELIVIKELLIERTE
jgi:peptidyl-prolyl cis-trans isomerase A (cyclophilin A)